MPLKDIQKSKQLIVEGKSAYSFFLSLLKQIELEEGIQLHELSDIKVQEICPNCGNKIHKVQVQNFGGIDELKTFLYQFTGAPGFVKVESIGIIRDAEENAENAFKSVINVLKDKDINLPAPKLPGKIEIGSPNLGIYILPGGKNEGMLEDICLESVKDEPSMSCVNDYFTCLKSKAIHSKNETKARVQAFLSSRKKPGLLLGEAAHKGYWPWENPVFDSLKEFLKKL